MSDRFDNNEWRNNSKKGLVCGEMLCRTPMAKLLLYRVNQEILFLLRHYLYIILLWITEKNNKAYFSYYFSSSISLILEFMQARYIN